MTKKRFLFLLPLLVLPFASCSKQTSYKEEVLPDEVREEDLIEEAEEDTDTSKYGVDTLSNSNGDSDFNITFVLNPKGLNTNEPYFQEVLAGDIEVPVIEGTKFRYVRKPIVLENDTLTSISGWSTKLNADEDNGDIEYIVDKDYRFDEATTLYPIFDRSKQVKFTFTSNVSNLVSTVSTGEYFYRQDVRPEIYSNTKYYYAPATITFSDNITNPYYTCVEDRGYVVFNMPMANCSITATGTAFKQMTSTVSLDTSSGVISYTNADSDSVSCSKNSNPVYSSWNYVSSFKPYIWTREVQQQGGYSVEKHCYPANDGVYECSYTGGGWSASYETRSGTFQKLKWRPFENTTFKVDGNNYDVSDTVSSATHPSTCYAYTRTIERYTYSFKTITWNDEIVYQGVKYTLQSGQGTTSAVYLEHH